MAVSLLIRLLDRHDLEALHVELATELVIRDSTARPPRLADPSESGCSATGGA